MIRIQEMETDLATGNASAERVLADANLFIHVCVGKVVLAPSHSPDKHSNVVCRG